MLVLQLLVLICLVFICYQDIRYRAVYWLCFPVLTGLLFFLKQNYAGIEETLLDAAYGSLFFGVQLFLLWIYFSLKNRKVVNLTMNFLGLGDIFFLVAIAFYLSPVNYVIFYIGSLILVLAITVIKQAYLEKNNHEIPLAGLQALMMVLVLIYTTINPSLQPYNDVWIYGI